MVVTARLAALGRVQTHRSSIQTRIESKFRQQHENEVMGDRGGDGADRQPLVLWIASTARRQSHDPRCKVTLSFSEPSL